jgi:hypothetical protein
MESVEGVHVDVNNLFVYWSVTNASKFVICLEIRETTSRNVKLDNHVQNHLQGRMTNVWYIHKKERVHVG